MELTAQVHSRESGQSVTATAEASSTKQLDAEVWRVIQREGKLCIPEMQTMLQFEASLEEVIASVARLEDRGLVEKVRPADPRAKYELQEVWRPAD